MSSCAMPRDPNYKPPIDPTPTNQDPPTLYRPLQIRSLLLSNRIVVSPMGMYSSIDGYWNDFHLMHYGHFAFRGAELTMTEVCAVTPNGRSSPMDAGIWSDAHIEGMKRVVDFVHGLEGDKKIGIQIGHAGRKAGMIPHYPGQKSRIATEEEGGWAEGGLVRGASAIPYMPDYVTPEAMEEAEVTVVVNAFADAAERAVKVGFDCIEIHAAHGYLLSSFLSPCSNHRSDSYGGSFKNRTSFLVEVVKAIRERIPQSIPFFVRISATDWMEHNPETPQWTLQDSIDLALILSDIGVDLLDVSSAANNPAQKIPMGDAFYQVNLAAQIRRALREKGKSMLVAAVGKIDNAVMARNVLEEEKADMVFVAKQFLEDPSLVANWAGDLGLEKVWPRQYIRLSNAPVGTL